MVGELLVLVSAVDPLACTGFASLLSAQRHRRGRGG